MAVTWEQLEQERRHWQRVAAGEELPRRDLYHEKRAEFASRCDGGCGRPVRRGNPIYYTSHAPSGFKVYHRSCFPETPWRPPSA